jgi:ketosteroid isomerase-like protein
MSKENVETVRRHNEAWNRRDLTAWLALFSSGAEIDWSRSRGPLKGVYRGPGEFEVFWAAFWSTFEDVHVEMHGFTEVGSEVVVPNTGHIRGRQGSMESGGFRIAARSVPKCSSGPHRSTRGQLRMRYPAQAASGRPRCGLIGEFQARDC